MRAHLQEVDEEVVGQRSGPLGEDAMLGVSGIGAEDAEAADQDGHFGRGQRQELRAIHEQSPRAPDAGLPRRVVAEAVDGRLERGEGMDVGLLLRGIHPARREGDLHVLAAVLRRLLDRRGAAENDQVGQRHLLVAGLGGIELFLDRLELAEHLGELRRAG